MTREDFMIVIDAGGESMLSRVIRALRQERSTITEVAASAHPNWRAAIGIVAIWIGVGVGGDGPPDRSVRGDESLDAMIGGLSNDHYSDRQAQSAMLWQHAVDNEATLEQALRHADPEVAARAQWVLRLSRLGLTPQTSPIVAEMLSNHRDVDDLMIRLLRVGEFRLVADLIRDGGDGPNGPLQAIRLSAYIQQFFPLYASIAFRDRSEHSLWQIIDQIAASPSLCLCRNEMAPLIGMELDDVGHLPNSARGWTQARRDEMTALLQAAEGNFAAARSIKIKTESLADLAMASSDIEAMVTIVEHQPENLLAKIHLLSEWHHRMIGGAAMDPRAAEIRETIEQTLREALVGLPPPTQWPDLQGVEAERVQMATQEIKRWAFALVRWGDVDAAIDWLQRVDPVAAGRIAIDLDRYAVAKTILVSSWNPLDDPRPRGQSMMRLSDWQQCITTALERQSEMAREGSSLQRGSLIHPDVDRILMWIELTWAMGNRIEAGAIAHALYDQLVFLDRLPGNNLAIGMVNTRFAQTLSGISHEHLIYSIIDRHDTNLANEFVNTIANTTIDCDEESFGLLRHSLRRIHPEVRRSVTTRMAHDLFEGLMPDSFDPESDFDAMFQQWIQLSRVINDANNQVSSQAWIALSRLFYRHGRIDLGDQMMALARQEQDVDAMLLQPKQLLQSGHVDEAALQYQDILARLLSTGDLNIARDDVHVMGLPRASTAHLIDVAVGLAQCGVAAGGQDAEDAFQRAQLLMCSPSGANRSSIASEADRLPPREMLASLERWLMLAAIQGESEDFYRPAVCYGELMQRLPPAEDRSSLRTPAFWLSLATNDYAEYVDFWRQISKALASFAIADGINRQDEAITARAIDWSLRVHPVDINLAETTMKQLQTAGFHDLAERTLQRVIESGRQWMTDYPADSFMANNLAWVAARANTALADAYRWSRIAVDANPDSVIYRDTLAEVLFAQGKSELADQIETACLIDDDDDWHVHQQIERFRTPQDSQP